MMQTDATVLEIRVKARASATRIAGTRNGQVLVEVSAPPVDGRANDAVCRLLAKALGLAAGHVAVIGGQRSRDKLVRIEGLSAAGVADRLGLTGLQR